MQRLTLDFVRARPASPWTGRVLLLIAAAFALDVGISYQQAQHTLAVKQAHLAKMEGREPQRRTNPEELAAARETVQRLATPWDNLFAALEAAASDTVALLSIEPDPRTGTVLISGDSKDYLSALTYVLNLSRAETLSKVELQRHEVKSSDPQRPVGFSVSAAWSEVKP